MSSSNADNPAHAKSDPCQFLSWDTAFFGIRIARVIGNSLSLESLDAIEKWCLDQKIRCLYFPARSDDAITVALAEQAGFHLVDIRMTFNRHVADTSVSTNATSTKLKMQKNDLTFRPAIPSDIPQLKAIARISHTDTRFFYDAKFEKSMAESLYETWIQKSMEGFAQHVLIADIDGKAVGYISCHISKYQENQVCNGSIGLIAVSTEHQGKGIGRNLVAGAMEWFLQNGVSTVSVVTQGRNVIAQKLYVSGGFTPSQLELYYHRWF